MGGPTHRAWRLGRCALAWLVVAGSSASSRADAPATPSTATASGVLAWVAPSSDAWAHVVAGTVLEVRVRLSLALTPPPGMQQRAALVGWAGRLAAAVVGLDTSETEASYPLSVTNVRPDGGSTLTYRVQLPIPPWVAPGTYRLALATPGGELTGAQVNVLATGTHPPGEARAGAPVHAPSDRVREAHSPATSHPPDPAAVRPFVHGAVQIERGKDRLRIASEMRDADADVRMLASGTVTVTVEGGHVAWYPSGSVAADGTVRALGVVRLEPGRDVVVTWDAGARGPIALRAGGDRRVQAGARSQLRVDGTDEGARVAWQVSDEAVAWGAAEIEHAFVRGGRESWTALAVGADGRVGRVSGEVVVEPGGAGGCSRTGKGLCGWWAGLWGALVVASRSATRRASKRAPRGGLWNRLRRVRRWRLR